MNKRLAYPREVRRNGTLRTEKDRISLLCSPATARFLPRKDQEIGLSGHQAPAIDGHQHFWNPARVPLPWLRPEHAAIARAFEPDELEPQLIAANVVATILVQSACSNEDTALMFEHARWFEWIAAVVAWLPLEHPDFAAARLDELRAEPKLRGVRHLIHDEPDPHWTLRAPVLDSIALVEAAGLVLELPAVFPRHLADVPELARSFPGLTIVIDHLGKPPLGRHDLGIWSEQLNEAAAHPNVAAKISGLNTVLDHSDWSASELRPAVETAFDAFGAERLLCGSDWPVSLLNGGEYARVWEETRAVLDLVAPHEADKLLSANAKRIYALDEKAFEAAPAHSMQRARDGAH